MNQYSLKMPKAVYSGEQALAKINEIVKDSFKKAAVFTDKGVERAGLLEVPLQFLKESKTEAVIIRDLPAEPDCDEAEEVMKRFRETGADFIMAVGGGSVMDMAKLASITADGRCTVRDLLKNPQTGRKTVPSLMIPTTAGTGSEVTMNSIVTIPEQQLKAGIVNTEMIPDYVILDGSLLKKLPKSIAAATGIDAMAHAVECYTSKKANPFSNLFAMEAIKLIFQNIIEACEEETAEAAKTNMLIAAFYAGIAISSSGTTAVHALSYPLGGKYHIPHGVSNAMLLLPVLRFNKMACLREFSEIYDALTGGKEDRTEEEKADRLLWDMETIIERLEIPKTLSAFGIGRADLEELVSAGLAVKRLLINNKREVSYEDARNLYLEIM